MSSYLLSYIQYSQRFLNQKGVSKVVRKKFLKKTTAISNRIFKCGFKNKIFEWCPNVQENSIETLLPGCVRNYPCGSHSHTGVKPGPGCHLYSFINWNKSNIHFLLSLEQAMESHLAVPPHLYSIPWNPGEHKHSVLSAREKKEKKWKKERNGKGKAAPDPEALCHF